MCDRAAHLNGLFLNDKPFSRVPVGVYLVPAAGALTQQRLAALVDVHSTI